MGKTKETANLVSNGFLTPNNGKLGIGTDNPDGKLDVRGTIFVNGDATGGRIFASGGNLSLTDGNGRQTLRIDDPGSGNTHTHVFNSNGRLGIGTDDPLRQLDIFSTGHATAALKGNTQSSLFFVDNDDSNIGQISYIHADNYMYFRVNDAERLRITSDGKVGIGSEIPDYNLTIGDGSSYVIQNLRAKNDEFCEFRFGDPEGVAQGKITYDNGTDSLRFTTNGDGEKLRIGSNGQIGMGKAGAVTVNGNSPLTIQESDSNSETICLRATNSGGNGSQPGIVMKTAAGGHIGGIYCDVNSDYMRLSTSGDDRVFITNTGEVGIGEDTPVHKLHVNGGVRGDYIETDGHAIWTQSVETGTGGESGGVILKTNPDQTSTNMSGAFLYRIRAVVKNTGTDTGATWLVYYKESSAAYQVRYISRSGTSSNHPRLRIVNTNQMELYTTHSSNYPVRVVSERFYTEEPDSTLHAMGSDYHWQRDNDDLTYSDGQIGIGTDNPNQPLHIHASGTSYVRFTDESSGTGASDGAIFGLDHPHLYAWNYETGDFVVATSAEERLRIKSNGVIQMTPEGATTAPNAAFDTTGDNFRIYSKKDGTDAIGLVFSTQASGGSLIERFRIDSTGRVNIGNDTGTGYYAQPVFQVHGHQNTPAGAGWMSVNSGTSEPSANENIALLSFVNGGNGEVARIECEAEAAHSGTSSSGRLVFLTTATGSARTASERMRISSGGKITAPGVYSGTTTGGGPVYVEADGDLLRYTSSLKYKTDVETIEDARADAILNVRPVWYRSKCENDVKTEGAEKSDWGWYGFIAEELAEIEPRLVNWATKDAVLNEEGSMRSVERDPADYTAEGVRYDNFVPLLVNLVQRQKTQIEALEKRLTDAGL